MVEETHLLTLIPQIVKGKLLTFNSLEKLIKHPKQGQATQYKCCWDEIKKEHGDIPLQASYWVLLTKDVIPESRDKSYDDQVQLVAKYSEQAKVAYEVPRLLETAVSLFMEYVQTGTRLYSDKPSTYTRCQESVFHSPSLVGNFAAGGLDVDDLSNPDSDDGVYNGVGGSWKL